MVSQQAFECTESEDKTLCSEIKHNQNRIITNPCLLDCIFKALQFSPKKLKHEAFLLIECSVESLLKISFPTLPGGCLKTLLLLFTFRFYSPLVQTFFMSSYVDHYSLVYQRYSLPTLEVWLVEFPGEGVRSLPFGQMGDVLAGAHSPHVVFVLRIGSAPSLLPQIMHRLLLYLRSQYMGIGEETPFYQKKKEEKGPAGCSRLFGLLSSQSTETRALSILVRVGTSLSLLHVKQRPCIYTYLSSWSSTQHLNLDIILQFRFQLLFSDALGLGQSKRRATRSGRNCVLSLSP